MDLLPTILDLCEIPLSFENSLDGKSLVPLLLNSKSEWPERQIYHIQNNGKLSMLNSALRNERHRFVLNRDSSMMLFDMKDDPGQTLNIIEQNPDLKIKYFNDLKNWFAEVTSLGISPPPIPIGFKEGGRVKLSAPEASIINGQMKFKGRMGWANDYFIDWKNLDDFAQWEIDVAKTGSYNVSIEYACKKEHLGSEILVKAGSETVLGKITKAHYPSFYPSPDYVKRGEVYERDWTTLELGTLQLSQGRSVLEIRATAIPQGEAGELKAVIIN